MQRGMGDVLVTFESEAEMIAKEFGKGEFEVVYPSLTMQAEFPVAVVDKVVDKKGTRKQADGLPGVPVVEGRPGESPPRTTCARATRRCRRSTRSVFPPVTTFTVDEVFGGCRRRPWPPTSTMAASLTRSTAVQTLPQGSA